SPNAVPAAQHPMPSPSTMAPAAAADAIDISAFDLGFKPAAITVKAAGIYPVSFHNTGAVTHDVTFGDGTKLTADPGKTVTGQVLGPGRGLPFHGQLPGQCRRRLARPGARRGRSLDARHAPGARRVGPGCRRLGYPRTRSQRRALRPPRPGGPGRARRYRP